MRKIYIYKIYIKDAISFVSIIISNFINRFCEINRINISKNIK